ncbi:MAG: hypothetical protein QXE84_07865 [Candidatus Nitrosotenuis sp.]|uniref:Uncharacterized protein n=1 Tax=Candidatus Nitrosotenuis uzonensis TaxID=1407055 RepID=A0A812F6I3_9ARCH|nr:hypothetical protein [Candidatus Nitrosotenuis uzonensis]CAE6500422.1 conserved hypothetical protein [Candidatus Nitrosotenuis uzonensis]
MVLIDKKILAGGIALLSVGLALLIYFSSTMPIGNAGMSEEEAFKLMIAERENRDYSTLASIMTGIGFLLVLISFGARRKKKGGATKPVEEKPPA